MTVIIYFIAGNLRLYRFPVMNNLDQLRTFLETYRLGSITKAAERLHITQPAASAHIKALETLIEKKIICPPCKRGQGNSDRR